MYPHFIEVHDVEDDSPVAINIDSIACVMKGSFQDAECGLINCRDAGGQVTKETYNEVKHLIESSGALINMGDPRLDTKHPLTFSELKEMVGEPIWNSNLMRWELITELYNDDLICTKTAESLDKTDDDTAAYFEDDLIKTPLYRMKVQNV